MSKPPASAFHAAMRSGLVLTGILLLAVGLGNLVAGQTKVEQYGQQVRARTPAHAPRDPAALFPAVSEGTERLEVNRAKLAFYQLLVTGGQLLAALGATLVGVGSLRVWVRAGRAQRSSPLAN